jgi:hypothetical protein
MLLWWNYDNFFKKLRRAGERTIGLDEDVDSEGGSGKKKWCKKSVRLVKK